MSWTKRIALVAVIVLIAVLVVPFLIPVPPLEDTVTAVSLADSDSLFHRIVKQADLRVAPGV